MRAENAIVRLRRDLALSSTLKGALAGAAVLAMFLQFLPVPRALDGPVILAAIGLIWLVLSYKSVRGSRLAAATPPLIAAGMFQEAEENIDAALTSFSLFRTVKLRSVHALAMLRHAQQRWYEAALLCQALLGQPLTGLGGVVRSARLILAESLLETGDAHGAHAALAGLYEQRLTLHEALELNLVQLDYLSRIGAWDQMMTGITRKVELAELLPAPKAARAQALLALAARHASRPQWERWLTRRVQLLADVQELAKQRPLLRELWPEPDGRRELGSDI